MGGGILREGGILPAVQPMKLSILVSAHDEGQTMVQAIQELLQVVYPCDIELIVIAERSMDGASTFLAQLDDPRVIVHHRSSSFGKEASLVFAASVASGSHILPFNSDLTYSPEDIPIMLEPILKGRCNVVYGVRLFGYNTGYRSYRHAAGNRFLTRVTNILFDSSLSDLHTRLKLMPIAMLKSLNLRQTGFGSDTELTASLLRCGIRPFEVPVSYYSQTYTRDNRITWRHAVICLWTLIRVRFRTQASLVGPMDSSFDGDRNYRALPAVPDLKS
jgi:glycosyltransferase involved in cell wall biosynthesis